jgi:hypothetical protein
MNENNTFKLDIDSEKTNFDSLIRTPQSEQAVAAVQFQPVTFSSENYLKPDFGSYSTPSMETLRPMSGKLTASLAETSPLLPDSASTGQINQGSSQEDIYLQMNNMSLAMNELNSKISKKQDLLSSDKAVTEARVTNDQKNIMFFDRVARSSNRFTWS